MPSAELTAADIARLAGVGRAAVSNWRRRHPDFPKPTGGTVASPTFDLDDVTRWLAANGRFSLSATKPTGPPTDLPPLARCLASLLPEQMSGTVIDPGCADSSALTAAAARFGDGVVYVAQCFTGAEADSAERHLARAASRYRVLVGEPFDATLAEYFGKADAVVSAPPPGATVTLDDAFDDRWEFGPPSRNDGALAWIQAAYSYLQSGGIAVVAIPFGAAVRASGRRIRGELLRAGAITHVIALPEETSRSGSPPLQIWVLRRPTGRPTYSVRMVDLTGQSAAELPNSPEDWPAIFNDPARTTDVPSIELLNEDVFLVPTAYVVSPPHDILPEYRDLATQYSSALRSLAPQPPAFDRTEPHDIPTVGLADLQRAGALEIRERQPAEPGDVIIPSGPGRIDAITVATGNEDVDRVGTVIRCDPEQVDSYFLACFLRSEANRRQAVGTQGGTFRLDLRRARVPRIPLTEQRRYGEAFRRLTDFAGQADAIRTLADEIVRTGVHGLTTGALAIQEPATGESN